MLPRPELLDAELPCDEREDDEPLPDELPMLDEPEPLFEVPDIPDVLDRWEPLPAPEEEELGDVDDEEDEGEVEDDDPDVLDWAVTARGRPRTRAMMLKFRIGVFMTYALAEG